MQEVYAALQELELMMDRANDLVEYRIEAVLHEMSTMTLCELPGEEPWSVEAFLERTQVSAEVWRFVVLWPGAHQSGFKNIVSHPHKELN